MSTPKSQRGDPLDSSSTLHLPSTPSRNPSTFSTSNDGASTASGNPTYASFSPITLGSTAPTAASAAKRRSTILVHQKSPLLLATPPQITRALAYSHPFLLPLNKLAGLLSWSTGDPWESFLLVVAFWATVLYGDVVIRMAGPIVLVLMLIAGMYGRRFSPLSSSGWSEPGQGNNDGSANTGGQKLTKPRKGANGRNSTSLDSSATSLPTSKSDTAKLGHQRGQSSVSEITNTRHQKTLDEIVATLKEFTSRCNILLEPALELTDFLSTQRTPTSATTRPALTTLFVRILLCTPFWVALTLPPLRIVTSRRVILVFGTVALTWHARVMRVGRTILWRSATVRRLAALVTGLEFESHAKPSTTGTLSASASTAASIASAAGKAAAAAAVNTPRESELTKALRRARVGHDAGVRFTFILYENQRRWVGLGWTTSLFAYERSAWTDEHNNAVPPRDKFELPEVENGSRMQWRWVVGGRWRVDGVPDEAVSGTEGKGKSEWDYNAPGGRMGWVYYDNKWQNGRRGQDGWGRWTRRRKWYRDAELVETDEEDEEDATQPYITVDTPDHDSSDDHTPTPQPALPSRPPRSPSPPSYPHAVLETQSAPNISADGTSDRDRAGERDDDYDSASLLSSSSRSARFRPPSLRRRVTDSSRGTGGSSASAGTAAGATGRPRRASEAVSEEEDALALGTRFGLEIQGAGKEGGSWGVGDEVRMGLE